MAMTTTTTLSNTLPAWRAAAKLTLKQTGVTRKRVDNLTLGKGKGLTYREPVLPTLAVIGLTQGNDLSQSQTMTDSLVSIAVTQAGGQVVVHDLAVDALSDPLIKRISETIANAYSNYIDNDLTSLFSGLDAGFGSSTSSFSPGWIQAAQARLQNATRPVQVDISIILQPYHYRDIASDISSLSSGGWVRDIGTPSAALRTGTSIDGMTEEVWKNYFMTRLAGADLFVDPTISISASASYSAIFARDAMIYVNYDEPTMRDEYDSSLRATELNYIGTQGRGERDGTWGFYFQADSTSPTA